MATQTVASDRRIGQIRQRIGQRGFIGKVGDGHDGALARKPPRRGHATAVAAQSQHGDSSAGYIHSRACGSWFNSAAIRLNRRV